MGGVSACAGAGALDLARSGLGGDAVWFMRCRSAECEGSVAGHWGFGDCVKDDGVGGAGSGSGDPVRRWQA